MRSRRLILSVIVLAAFASKRASADIAPNPMTGGRPIALYNGEATDVRMVEEDVSVRIFADSIVTAAVFLMHNGGETVDMQVGFPFFYPDDLLEFRAFIDGRPVAVADTTKENVGRKKSTIHWKLWDMTFRSGEPCTVRVEYRTKPFLNPAMRIGTPRRYRLPIDACESMEGASMIGLAEYYLATGKEWKGVLDRCRVSFELVGLSGAHIMASWPKDGVITGNVVIWEYADYEPAGFISLRYCPNMPVGEIPGFLRGFLDQFPDYAPLASDIGTTLRSDFGRSEMQRDIYHSFLARWDRPIPQLMEYAPGGRCRFNYRAEGHFYTVWRMAHILFEEYCRDGMLDRARDIAPNVARVTGAVVDSLDTCYLSDQDEYLMQQARELLDLCSGLIEEPR